MDRETLRQFVDGSIGWLSALVAQVGFQRANAMEDLAQRGGGPFKSGPIYLFIVTPEGYVIFRGADAWREGRTVIDNTDFQGRPFVRHLISVAQSGGGFIEYFWDDPTVQGDADTGTPKVSYTRALTSDLDEFQGIEFIVAAGFYRNFSTAEAENASRDWLARFGRSVASQAMEMIGHRVSPASGQPGRRRPDAQPQFLPQCQHPGRCRRCRTFGLASHVSRKASWRNLLPGLTRRGGRGACPLGRRRGHEVR